MVLLAVFMAGIRAVTRPIPMAESIEFVTGRTTWSDGVVTSGSFAELEVPRPVQIRYIPFFRVAWWSDGWVTFQLH